ncbi:sugar phosphate isomerase/epimerase family protein [Kerstersia similis]|uniref:sugar phosphate isomerase/epimerase family protein n=1 Tax=Kerstersia similis TaxID=206505 RepID=UPI0039F078ED
MNIGQFGIDSVSLAGPLQARLAAAQTAGFTRISLSAQDLVEHPQGLDDAIHLVRCSGLEVTALQALRDYEGLPGLLREYKTDIAKHLLELCQALDCRMLIASASTSGHASQDQDIIATDLRRLATLAIPLNIRIAYEAISWARTVNDYRLAWHIVEAADSPNLGLVLDSYHILATATPLAALSDISPEKIFLVQLADFLWHSVDTVSERRAAARHFRVFPGEGPHNAQLTDIVMQMHEIGYTGPYSFEVFNDDYRQLPASLVAKRAHRAAAWLSEAVLRQSAPMPVFNRHTR